PSPPLFRSRSGLTILPNDALPYTPMPLWPPTHRRACVPAYDRRVTDYARRERRELADLLLAVGPDAPPLCAGWTARDLAAHLVIRERRPDATVAGLIPPLAGRVAHVRPGTR